MIDVALMVSYLAGFALFALMHVLTNPRYNIWPLPELPVTGRYTVGILGILLVWSALQVARMTAANTLWLYGPQVVLDFIGVTAGAATGTLFFRGIDRVMHPEWFVKSKPKPKLSLTDAEIQAGLDAITKNAWRIAKQQEAE